jgi:small-conductance mechanosensitive channel
LEGNYIQIPNATVYKSNIKNYTSNPNRREDFIIGIGYDCVLSEAQDIALKVLQDHPAVLKDPEPWVLVDSFGKSTINLKIYFWLDGKKHSWLKLRSSVIRLVKRAFQSNNIDMPDEARELIFPKGITVWMASPISEEERGGSKSQDHQEVDKIATTSEGELNSEADDIQVQGLQSQVPEPGKNLLKQKSPEI